MKKEGPDSAEPSLEGPVGQTTGNRPLNNQLPVNPTVAFQNAGPWFRPLGRALRVQISLSVTKNSVNDSVLH